MQNSLILIKSNYHFSLLSSFLLLFLTAYSAQDYNNFVLEVVQFQLTYLG